MPVGRAAKFRDGVRYRNSAERRLCRCSTDFRDLRSFTRAHRRCRSQFQRRPGVAPRVGRDLSDVDTINCAPDLRARAIFHPCRARELGRVAHRGRRNHLGSDSAIFGSRRSRRQNGNDRCRNWDRHKRSHGAIILRRAPA